MEKVISEVAQEYDLSRFTLQQVASKGTIPARQSGDIWLIDDDTEEFKSWLAKHRSLPGGKRGRKTR